jgi:hypothetical protein
MLPQQHRQALSFPKAYLFVIGCLATLVAGSDNYTEIADLPALPHYEVQRVSGGVTVDGVLNDSAWKAYGVRAISLMFPCQFRSEWQPSEYPGVKSCVS